MVVSSCLVLASAISLGLNGLNFGLDFTGGAMIEIGFGEEIDPELVRERLEVGGFENGTGCYILPNVAIF